MVPASRRVWRARACAPAEAFCPAPGRPGCTRQTPGAAAGHRSSTGGGRRVPLAPTDLERKEPVKAVGVSRARSAEMEVPSSLPPGNRRADPLERVEQS